MTYIDQLSEADPTSVRTYALSLTLPPLPPSQILATTPTSRMLPGGEVVHLMSCFPNPQVITNIELVGRRKLEMLLLRLTRAKVVRRNDVVRQCAHHRAPGIERYDWLNTFTVKVTLVILPFVQSPMVVRTVRTGRRVYSLLQLFR